MVAAGIEIGAHTRTHPPLTTLATIDQRREIEGSRGDLERQLGVPVRMFAYPFGAMNEQTAAIVSAAGFDGACGSRSGGNDPATPLYNLRRLEVRGEDSLLDFALLLWRAHRSRPSRSSPTVAQAEA
jgi:peptidoglycan/xylan/chitin deacetylase (PgdA/CDA1 family)